MEENFLIEPIARIRTDFSEKFGIPRQSGLVNALSGRVVFEPEYRRAEAVRDLDGFSHLWLIWQFSACAGRKWSPTVRPPRLGGNRRVGVVASRSPFRPNHLGLSSEKLDGIDFGAEDGPVLLVSRIDMLDGTPVFDIKPYVPAYDCHPAAREGYTVLTKEHQVPVEFPQELLRLVPEDKRDALLGVLASDPRPGYDTEEKEYGVAFSGFNVRFRAGENGFLVTDVEKLPE